MTQLPFARHASLAADRVPSVSITVGTPIGTADPRLFGSFVEHLGRGVYGGIFDPDHAAATAEGFRSDVIALVRELGVTIVRYPGGNFVSGYDWRDGVGPATERPRRLDLAWKSVETNEFGTDEFIAWCRATGAEPMLALNLGLSDVRSALQLLEYSNHPSGTTRSDERIANGSPLPHAVRTWCLGNELDGPWQLGNKSAEQYANIAGSAASAMRMFDPSLELVVVGSSNADMPTFGAWEETVLERTIELVDYLSCHIYFYEDDDLGGFLRSADIYLTNRSRDAAAAAEVDLGALDPRAVTRAQILWDPDPHAANTADDRERVAPRTLATSLHEGRLRLTLPPISSAVVELSCSADR